MAARTRFSGPIRLVTATAVIAASLAIGAHGLVPAARAMPVVASSVSPPVPGSQAALLPAPGEFVSVPLYRVLDTRSGTGESGGAAQLGSGDSLAVAVTGMDGIPSDATSVVVNVVALNTTASGYLTTYDSDITDPNIASVGVKAGISTNQTDTIPVSSTGTVSVANHSSAPLNVVMSVMGYYTGQSDTSAGDTYSSAPWIKIIDTTTGEGTTQAPIPAGGSITVQVSGEGGIASGADTAVVQISALNASNNGWLTAYAAGTTDPGVSVLYYDDSMTYRDLSYVPLSSAGRMTITNHGSAAVDLKVVTRGYFMPPSTTPVGAEYVPVSASGPVIVYGTSSGGTQVAANGSATFQVSGTAGLPATGVVEVAEHLVVTHPSDSGYLDAYRADGTDPNNATMNFVAGDGTDVGYQDSILSTVSPTGQEIITNHSSGTINVQVAVVGAYFNPQVPVVPSYLQNGATYSTTPVLSGIVQDNTGDDVTGEIFLFDSSGNPIGGSPTATGVVSTGEAVTWTVTAGTLTNGSTYQWYMEACDQGVCSAPSATQVFTINTANAPQPPTATANATITGSQVTGTDGITDSGACSGSDCATASNGTLHAGYDGTNNWASGLEISLSSIPVGSTIVSATLTLTESACLTGTGCASSAINVYPAGSDVGSASTGPQLAAAANSSNPYTATSPATQGTWDITNIVAAWEAGDNPNDGLEIQAPTAGTEGIAYYSPSANEPAADLPQVSIGYIPPTVPGAPANLQVTPGDGGALVTWSDPSWNYADDTGTSTANFTIQAINSQGAVVGTQTTTSETAVMTGLTDGTSYTLNVTATNPIGTGPAATSTAVTPAAVAGGSSQYVTAVNQYVNGQDAIDSGQAPTATAALTGKSMEAADITGLSNQDLALSPTAVTAAANSESLVNDATTLSNTLAMPAANGQTVTVYAEVSESYTINDTSSGTLLTYPGGGSNDELFTFVNPGSSPQLTGSVDADAALGQASPGDDQTAWSPVLDASFISATDSNAPAPLAIDAFGNFTAGTDSCGASCDSGVLTNISKWAAAHALCGGLLGNDKKCWDGFTAGCTDFLSRALQLGGGVGFMEGQQAGQYDLDQWYFNSQHHFESSSTWAGALYLADLEWRYGGHFYPFAKNPSKTSDVKDGSFIFASFRNNHFDTINHAGVVVAVLGKNLVIAQHDVNTIEPLWASAGVASWFNHKVVAAWAVAPYTGGFVDHTAIDCDNYNDLKSCTVL